MDAVGLPLIPLPPNPAPHARFPPAPANPPTHADFLNAHWYHEDVKQIPHAGNPPGIHLTESHQYLQSIAAMAPGLPIPATGGPVWFNAAMAAQNALMVNQHNAVMAELVNLKRKLAKSMNRHAGTGTGNHLYEVLTFLDSTDPTQPPHNLPALTTDTIIDNLPFPIVNWYLVGYGLPQVGTTAVRRQAIKDFVGCMV